MAAATSRSLLPPALRCGSPSAPATLAPAEPVHRLGCLKSRPLSVPAPARTCLFTSLRLPPSPIAAIGNTKSADDADCRLSYGKETAVAGHFVKSVIIATAPLGALLLTSGPASAFSGSHAYGGLGQGELGWSESLPTNAGGGGGGGGGQGGGGGGGGGGSGGPGGSQQPGTDYSNDLDDDDVDEADNPDGISEPVSRVDKSASAVPVSSADAVAMDASGGKAPTEGRDPAWREFPKRRSSSRRRHGASGNGGAGATLLNSYPPDVLFASLSAVAGSAGRAGASGDDSATAASAGGGSSSSAGGLSSGTISSRRRRPDDERMRRADGMFDWMAGLLHSMLASRLDGMQDRVDRQALMAETADLVVQILDKRSADDAFAHRSEVSALRRLQREAFQDLLRVKDRLHRLEFLSGVRQSPDGRSPRPSAGSVYSASAAAFGATSGAFGTGIAGIGEESGVWGGLGAGGGSVLGGAGRTRLHGEIVAGGAFVPTEGARSHSTRAALEQAGMRSGLTVKFRFDTTCRDDDLLSTELTAGLGEDSSSFMLGGPVNIHKILYSTKLCDGVQLAVAPLGAVGSDMAEGMNPLKDQGLTRFSSGGISLHRRARGSALAFSLRNSAASFTAAQFLSGWGVSQDPEGESAGLCASSLAQLSLQPQDNVVLSMSALNRLWPSPPLPSATGLHWSEMGPLVVPKLLPWLGKLKKTGSGRSAGSGDGSSGMGGAESSSGVVGQELWLPPDQEPATMVQSVAVSGAVQLGAATIAAWAQAENGDCLDEDARRKLQWSVSLLLQGKGRAEDEAGYGGTGGSSANGAGGKAGGGKGKKGKWTDRISLGACIGGTQPDAFFLGGGAESSSTGMVGGESGEGNEGGAAGAGQVQAEAFMRVKCGRGLKCSIVNPCEPLIRNWSKAVGATWRLTGGASRRWGGGRRAGPVPLCSYGLRDTWQRESGRRTPLSFARAAGGSDALVSRLALASVLASHRGCVNTVAFTPSGSHLLSGSDDQRIVLWDWAAAREVLKWRSGHGNNVFQARALPCGNDRTIVTCAADGQPSTHVLTVTTTPAMRARQPLPLNAVAHNPARPHLFAVGGADEFARVYDLRRCMACRAAPTSAACSCPSPVETFAPPHLINTNRDRLRPPVHITCVAYSPHDELLASYNDELIYLFHPHHSLGPDPLSMPTATRTTGFRALSTATSSSGRNRSSGNGGGDGRGSSRRRFVSSLGGDWSVGGRGSRGRSISGDGRLGDGEEGGSGSGGAAAASSSPAMPGGGSSETQPPPPRRLSWLQRTFHTASGATPDTAAAPLPDATAAGGDSGASPAAATSAIASEGAARNGREEAIVCGRGEEGNRGAREMADKRRRECDTTGDDRGDRGGDRKDGGEEMEESDERERDKGERDEGGRWGEKMQEAQGKIGYGQVGREGQGVAHMAENDEEEGEEQEEEEAAGAYGDRIEVYSGHRNEKTVKGVSFFGPRCEYVASGSDCGHVFLWRKVGGQLVAMMPGDVHVVNCLEPHPSATILATSGIESTVKIWAPTATSPKGLPSNAQSVMEANKRRREQPFGVPRMAADVEIPRLRLQRQHAQLMGRDRVATFGSLLALAAAVGRRGERRGGGEGGGREVGREGGRRGREGEAVDEGREGEGARSRRRVASNRVGGGDDEDGDGNDGGISTRNGGGRNMQTSDADEGSSSVSLRETLIARLGERAGIRDLFPFLEEDYSEDESEEDEEFEEGEAREEEEEDEEEEGDDRRRGWRSADSSVRFIQIHPPPSGLSIDTTKQGYYHLFVPGAGKPVPAPTSIVVTALSLKVSFRRPISLPSSRGIITYGADISLHPLAMSAARLTPKQARTLMAACMAAPVVVFAVRLALTDDVRDPFRMYRKLESPSADADAGASPASSAHSPGAAGESGETGNR
ncbi:unnamed protein product [Closterium sp. NIES-54]